jgi:CspA family cold shock protein
VEQAAAAKTARKEIRDAGEGIKTMTGTVVKYREDRLYGFIKPDDGSEDMFFHREDIQEDSVGRRFATIGLSVEFEIASDPTGKNRARNIRPLWEDPDPVDPIYFREKSIITRWFDRSGSGLARRPDGGTAYVSSDDVISEGTIGVGTHIWHGVRSPDLGEQWWHATDIEVILPQTSKQPSNLIAAGTAKPIEHDVATLPKKSILPADPRLKNCKLRNIKIRKSA